MIIKLSFYTPVPLPTVIVDILLYVCERGKRGAPNFSENKLDVEIKIRKVKDIVSLFKILVLSTYHCQTTNSHSL